MKYLIAIILGITLPYLIIVFVGQEPDFRVWSQQLRFFYAITSVYVVAFFLTVLLIDSSFNNMLKKLQK